MPSLFNRLLGMLALSSAAVLRRQVQFLRAENEILRGRLTRRIRTTPQDRARLIRLGRPLGSAIHSLISIVTPATFVRWVNRQDRQPTRRRRRRGGRPRTPEDVRQLVLRLARETDWGYCRIQGELKKLGVRLSLTTILNILKESGVPNRQRPHSALAHCTPAGRGPPEVGPVPRVGELGCEVRLGGFVRHYFLRAA